MAARNKAWTPEKVRQRIQATQLINRLHGCAMGKVELTLPQLRAIEILLKKTIPDLASVTLKGDANAPVQLILEGSDRDG